MADFNSSLPVRTQTNGDVVAFIADGTTNTQLLAISSAGHVSSNLFDGLGTAINSQTLSTSQWLQVVEPASGSSAPGTASSFANLIAGQYSATLPTLTDGQQAAIQVDSSGRLLISPTDTLSVTVTNFPNPVDTNYGVVGASTIRTAAEIGNATGAANFNYGAVGAQTLRVASQIGNASGAADFGAGSTDAQTLRVSANQGVAAALAGAWPMEITDGTNGPVAVKAASTPAAATDPSLVVALSPNSPLPTGTNSIGTVNVSNLPTTVDTNYGTVGASTIRTAAQIGNASGAADFNNGATDAQTLRVAANLAVAGANVSATNPVPVSLVSSTPGTAIQDYHTSVALAAGSSVTFTYTVVAAHTFNLERVWASASGKIKAVVANNGSNIFVGFNSTATPNIDITVISPPTIAAGNTVTVTITNNDLLAFDVYATIEGNQN